MTAPRRRRRFDVPPGFLILGAGLGAGVALAHASAIVWALLMALAASVAYMLGRLHGQKPARKPPTEFAKRKRAAQRAASTPASSSPRGGLPPASPDLLPMMISEYCSDGACALCPGNGCEHDCRHDPAEIVARNQREYDRTHGAAS
jgi:hypothetical protein